jgi:hypothetical protein
MLLISMTFRICDDYVRSRWVESIFIDDNFKSLPSRLNQLKFYRASKTRKRLAVQETYS